MYMIHVVQGSRFFFEYDWNQKKEDLKPPKNLDNVVEEAPGVFDTFVDLNVVLEFNPTLSSPNNKSTNETSSQVRKIGSCNCAEYLRKRKLWTL
jgi:hypothetical protein